MPRPEAPAGRDFLIQFLPFILIFVIMYFLIIRPQQAKAKQHQEMVASRSAAATRSSPPAA